MGTEPAEVYEKTVIDYVDNVYRSEAASQHSRTLEMVDKENKDKIKDHSSDLEKEPNEVKEDESDAETLNSSVSSHGGDLQAAEDEKVERVSRVPKMLAKKDSSHSSTRAARGKSDRGTNNIQVKASPNTPKKAAKSNRSNAKATAKSPSDNAKDMKVHPKPSSESSEGVDDIPLEEVKEVDIFDEASNGGHTVGNEQETVNGEEIVENEDNAALNLKIEEMETRIEKLEEELREVAALEISLYSTVPEHGSSAHKVHTPARRLARLYIHACKHWSQNKRATIAKNTVSGLVLIAKSCGNDVPRLTFWLSNTVVLRECITQAFASSCQSSSLTRIFESNGGKKSEGKPASLKWKCSPNKNGLVEFVDDWQETRTFTAALEKVESWIFSRIVESIWWQTLTPSMQSSIAGMSHDKITGRLLGPLLGDQQHGSFSIDLWKNAFQDAFKRLCPVRAGGHECGCLPVLARMVMEHCVARLDVAMFNAILRESAHEIPTDPVSDPIVDPKVLPIPAGDLSFGSGAQLKNSVGNWSRWLTDLFGMDADDSVKQDQNNASEIDEKQDGEAELKCFNLLNALSDLLMLPKDLLMDRSIRAEVCPSISLPLLKRILCNFTPDEFCPDPVPGTVLEAVNAECIIERRLSGETAGSFPYAAAPVAYKPPSSADVAEKVAEAGGKSHLARNASVIQRKGYTSDEELEELDSPLTSIIDKLPPSPSISLENGDREHIGVNTRYELLREVWLA
ncbi:hypothetical protein LguiA_014452 [Lonicera macranthoides]